MTCFSRLLNSNAGSLSDYYVTVTIKAVDTSQYEPAITTLLS